MNLLFANDRRGEYPPSWYAETAMPLAAFPPPDGTTRAQVCIIGGGYTGLSAALHLAEGGMDVVLLEAHRVGFGASGRNGGQVGSGQRLDQDALEHLVGQDAARRLWDIGEDAKALVRDLIARHAIPTRFAPGIVHACRSGREVRHAAAYAGKLARDYGYAMVEPLDRDGLRAIVPSDAYVGGSIDRGAGHIHPLSYAKGLARAAAAAGARIHEGAYATRIVPGARPVVETDTGARVKCEYLILAANGYLGDLQPSVAARVMPINNFIVATEPLGPRAAEVLRENVAVADSRFVVNYWRLSEDKRLLFGGGENYTHRFPSGFAARVRRRMLGIYPGLADVAVTHSWGGTLAITRTRMPCFARPAPNILSASGYSGHGVAMASLAGKILAEAIAGQAGRFDVMAAVPTPAFPGGTRLRAPLLALATAWYAMRDRLGI